MPGITHLTVYRAQRRQRAIETLAAQLNETLSVAENLERAAADAGSPKFAAVVRDWRDVQAEMIEAAREARATCEIIRNQLDAILRGLQ
jgi:hypothetical protein